MGSGGRLPKRCDSTFWASCCQHFRGHFTARQLEGKVRTAKRRFVQLSCGLAKCIKFSEHDTFRVWTQIMAVDQGGQSEKSSHHAPNKPPSTQTHERAWRTTGTNAMGVPSKGDAPGVSAAGKACAREEEGQDISICSTANVTKESQYSHHENYGANAKHAAPDVHATADIDESARNMALFRHIIAADLATASKTLAQFLLFQGRVAAV